VVCSAETIAAIHHHRAVAEVLIIVQPVMRRPNGTFELCDGSG
jgi:hypothetical protein